MSKCWGYDPLPGVTYVEGVKTVKIAPQPKLIKCPICGSHRVSFKGGKNRVFMTCNARQNGIVNLELFVPIVKCNKCGLARQINVRIADPKRHYTRSLARVIKKRLKTRSVIKVADSLGLTKRNIDDIRKYFRKKE